VDGLPSLTEVRARVTAPASALSPEAEINENRFHGTRPPTFELSEEKPWHRWAAYLFASGYNSMKEVASACQVSEPTVRNLLRQPWFQERVTKLMAVNGGKDIMAMLRAEQFNSMIVMIEIRDNKNTPAPVRANICKDILDRTLGKAVQRIQTEDVTASDDPVAEAHRLEEELARSRERSGEQ
jgi:hypothetical protein